MTFGPLPLLKLHLYRGKDVGIQPKLSAKTVKIWNFAHKFAHRGRFVCTIFTNFSAFTRVYM